MENLKAVWRYYVLAFAGLGLLWLVRERTGPVTTVVTVVGAVAFITGVFLTLYWSRRQRKAAEAEEEKYNKK